MAVYDAYDNLVCSFLTSGHFQIIRLLLENKCNVNSTNDMGRSALIEAAEHGHADIVKLLIEHNANVNLQDQEGMY